MQFLDGINKNNACILPARQGGRHFAASEIFLSVIVLNELDKTRYGGNLIFACKITHIYSVVKLKFRCERNHTDLIPLCVPDIGDKGNSEALADKRGNTVLIGRLADDLRMQIVTAEKGARLFAQAGCMVVGEDGIIVEAIRIDTGTFRQFMSFRNDDDHSLPHQRYKPDRYLGRITCSENDVIFSALKPLDIFRGQSLGKMKVEFLIFFHLYKGVRSFRE